MLYHLLKELNKFSSCGCGKRCRCVKGNQCKKSTTVLCSKPEAVVCSSGELWKLPSEWKTETIGDKVVFTVDLPGVTVNEVNLDLQDNTIYIASTEKAPRGYDYVVRLKEKVSPVGYKAVLESGVLTITFQLASDKVPLLFSDSKKA